MGMFFTSIVAEQFVAPDPIVPPIDAVYPPTVRDLYFPLGTGLFRHLYPLDTPLADPCPCCGAFNMTAGDAQFLGTCGFCFEEEQRDSY